MADEALSSTPHDAFAKDVLSDTRLAMALLRPRLSQEIASRITWSTLRLEPSSFVKNSLLQLHSDLLFSAQAGDRKVLVYVLLEHQSTTDVLMPQRLQAYRQEIWQDHVAKNPDSPLPLPHAIPFVLHQGPDPWEASTRFEDLFDCAGQLACMQPHVPKFEHVLFDLTKFEPRDQEQDPTLRMVLELMKRIRSKNEMLEFFAWLADVFPDNPFPVELLRRMLTYVWSVDTSIDSEQITRTVEHNPRLGSTVMTYLETIIAEGKAEGLAEGEARGRWIGKIQLLEGMMKMPVSADEAFTGFDAAELRRRFEALEGVYAGQYKSRM